MSFSQNWVLPPASKKNVPPATKVTCFGISIDTKEHTVSIPPEKLEKINKIMSRMGLTCKHDTHSLALS